jgi:hypothetical protein
MAQKEAGAPAQVLRRSVADTARIDAAPLELRAHEREANASQDPRARARTAPPFRDDECYRASSMERVWTNPPARKR